MSVSARLDPETILHAYSQGVFPMAEADGEIRWYTADPRGVIPLDGFHIPHSLAQFMRSARYPFKVRVNTAFERTMRGCMMQRHGATWISDRLVQAYLELHRMGFAHSVETWQGDELAGGLYGVSLGGAFFGESMFHMRRDASKCALVELVARLRDRRYVLLDTQATTSHLARFGCTEISAREYLVRLRHAIELERSFT
ncbi:MAG: leucyl/phenylalanyl-tRNA--protein transferase [Tepidisphaeraceae bacterium]|jgi:leucyl/phenylalanyl-tRNA--protein transferase